MAEWSIAAVLKTVVLRGTGGSNPSLSAKRNGKERQANLNVPFLFLFARRLAVAREYKKLFTTDYTDGHRFLVL